MVPQGRFFTVLDPSSAKRYLGFAGGSGITPVLSIIKTVLSREPNATFTLVYANRQVGGEISGDLMTTALPAASAGAKERAQIETGSLRERPSLA